MLERPHDYTKLETDEAEAHDLESVSEQSITERQRFRYHTPSKMSFYVVSVLMNVFFLAMWVRAERRISKASGIDCIRPQLTFSSAYEDGAIEYERHHVSRSLDKNPYTGGPRPEHDDAWRKLIEPMTTFITSAEFEAANLGSPTLALKDGSGYIGELSVYHELHCIRRIRQYMNLDHYRPNMTAVEHNLEAIHIDHCLEYFREAAMCRADSSVATYFWREGYPTSRVYSDHECVNWNKFDEWARSRMLLLTDLTVLDETDRWKYVRTSEGKTALREDPEVEVHP